MVNLQIHLWVVICCSFLSTITTLYLKPLGLIIEPLSIPPKPSLFPQYFQRYQMLQRRPDVLEVLRCPAPSQKLLRYVTGAPPLVEEVTRANLIILPLSSLVLLSWYVLTSCPDDVTHRCDYGMFL
jgi:hypothetical protein